MLQQSLSHAQREGVGLAQQLERASAAQRESQAQRSSAMQLLERETAAAELQCVRDTHIHIHTHTHTHTHSLSLSLTLVQLYIYIYSYPHIFSFLLSPLS